MYCVGSIGEMDTFWKYKIYSEAMFDQMLETVNSLQENGYLVKVYKQVLLKEIMK